jgi:hypothetical protein
MIPREGLIISRIAIRMIMEPLLVRAPAVGGVAKGNRRQPGDATRSW